jgi:hypothetical protein
VTPHDRDRQIRRLEVLADWLDSRFRIWGTELRFGLDSILGLIPGLGDGATAAPAFYLVYCAKRLGVPGRTLLRMTLNVALDLLIGAVPLLGDFFDIGFKANRRNLELIRRHFEDSDIAEAQW